MPCASMRTVARRTSSRDETCKEGVGLGSGVAVGLGVEVAAGVAVGAGVSVGVSPPPQLAAAIMAINSKIHTSLGW